MEIGVELKILSDTFSVIDVLSTDTSKEIRIPCFYSTFKPNAMVYWFQIKFFEDSEEFDTSDKTSTFNRSAFLLPNLNSYEYIKCGVLYRSGLLNISFS